LPAKFIATVRGGAFFAGGASCSVAGAPAGVPGVGRRLGTEGISCVPGFFARGGAGGGVTDERALSIALSTACWNAPRCERALLTASGETWDGSLAGGGGADGDFVVSLATSPDA
jgi:hypothetical protein